MEGTMQQRSDGMILVSLYHFVTGVMSLLIMCMVVAMMLAIGFGIVSAQEPGSEVAAPILALVALLVGVVFLAVAIANIVVGWGLWQRREWARVGALALAILRLLNIPLGTIAGGLIIWYLLQERTRAEFTAR
jgi:hypothetical protein